jgi:hypothetical protein
VYGGTAGRCTSRECQRADRRAGLSFGASAWIQESHDMTEDYHSRQYFAGWPDQRRESIDKRTWPMWEANRIGVLSVGLPYKA